MEQVAKADCKAVLRRLLEKGPPVWLADKHALPLPDDDTHVCKLWFSSSGEEVSAMLDGALDGAEREAKWDELKAIGAAVMDSLPDEAPKK